MRQQSTLQIPSGLIKGVITPIGVIKTSLRNLSSIQIQNPSSSTLYLSDQAEMANPQGAKITVGPGSFAVAQWSDPSSQEVWVSAISSSLNNPTLDKYFAQFVLFEEVVATGQWPINIISQTGNSEPNPIVITTNPGSIEAVDIVSGKNTDINSLSYEWVNPQTGTISLTEGLSVHSLLYGQYPSNEGGSGGEAVALGATPLGNFSNAYPSAMGLITSIAGAASGAQAGQTQNQFLYVSPYMGSVKVQNIIQPSVHYNYGSPYPLFDANEFCTYLPPTALVANTNTSFQVNPPSLVAESIPLGSQLLTYCDIHFSATLTTDLVVWLSNATGTTPTTAGSTVIANILASTSEHLQIAIPHSGIPLLNSAATTTNTIEYLNFLSTGTPTITCSAMVSVPQV